MSNTISKLISKTVPTNLSTASILGACAMGFAVSATAATEKPATHTATITKSSPILSVQPLVWLS